MDVIVRQAARVVVVDRWGRILLLHTCDPARPGTEFWEPPGGGLRDGETLEEGALRELYEETGIALQSLGPRLGVVDVDGSFGGRRFRQQETIFEAQVDQATCKPAALDGQLERDAHLGHRWWPLDRLLEAGLSFHPPELPTLLRRLPR